MNSHGVDSKHESLEHRADFLKVADSLDNAWLKCRSVGYFQQWVDIVEVNLPEPKDLNGLRLQAGNVDDCFADTEQDLVVIFVYFIPCLSSGYFANMVYFVKLYQ